MDRWLVNRSLLVLQLVRKNILMFIKLQIWAVIYGFGKRGLKLTDADQILLHMSFTLVLAYYLSLYNG